MGASVPWRRLHLVSHQTTFLTLGASPLLSVMDLIRKSSPMYLIPPFPQFLPPSTAPLLFYHSLPPPPPPLPPLLPPSTTPLPFTILDPPPHSCPIHYPLFLLLPPLPYPLPPYILLVTESSGKDTRQDGGGGGNGGWGGGWGWRRREEGRGMGGGHPV